MPSLARIASTRALGGRLLEEDAGLAVDDGLGGASGAIAMTGLPAAIASTGRDPEVLDPRDEVRVAAPDQVDERRAVDVAQEPTVGPAIASSRLRSGPSPTSTSSRPSRVAAWTARSIRR